jgi:thioredoxin
MKKKVIIAVTVAAFAVIGAAIVGWSVYRSGDFGKAVAEKIHHFTDENFETNVMEASKKRPVLVDFYADWCYPCKMLDPVLKEVANDLRGGVVIGKVDIDRNLISKQLGISRIPAIIIIKDGEIKQQFLGPVPKKDLVAALKQHGA